jgi:uncharacterized cofD-like protein
MGGGHGLAVSLRSLRRVTDHVTAVVTVADDGGSSGRLREDFDVLPPGDLRMALAALCADDDWGSTWARVLQHRFGGDGSLSGHALGNLLMVAVWEQVGDTVAGLDLVGELLGSRGRVLPMAAVPLTIQALCAGATATDPPRLVVGQNAVAASQTHVIDIALCPVDPPARPEAVAAVRAADVVVLGPGSWYTSVLPHLLVPELREALITASAARVLVLNLAPEGETAGFTPQMHLGVIADYAPDLRFDAVICDPATVDREEWLRRTVRGMGAELILTEVATAPGSDKHDPQRLAGAFSRVQGRGKMPAWR